MTEFSPQLSFLHETPKRYFTELFIGSNMLRFAVKMLSYSKYQVRTRHVLDWLKSV